MTDKHLNAILGAYIDMFVAAGHSPSEMTEILKSTGPSCLDVVFKHLSWMMVESRQMLVAGDRDKADRWLGFVQGCLFQSGHFTIDQLREHSKPPERGGKLPEANSLIETKQRKLPWLIW